MREVVEGVRSPRRDGRVGHEGSYLCRQHRGEGQAAVDGDGAAVGVGMGCVERSLLEEEITNDGKTIFF